MIRVVTPLGLFAMLAGCTMMMAPHITAGELADRAKADLLAAQRDYAGRFVFVRGVVRATTLASRHIVQAVGGPYYSVVARSAREEIPLVVLDPGTVFCYFEPGYIDDAVGLKQGDKVELRCRVDSFRTGSTDNATVLSDCRQQQRY